LSVIAFVLIIQLGGLGTLFPEQFAELALASAKGVAHSTTFKASPLTQLALNIVFGLMGFAYWAGMESSSKQATYGKRMFGLKVTDEEGFKIGFWHACGRYLAKVLSFLTLFIGFLMAAFTEKKQALHDKVGKTLVIREGSCFIWSPIKIVIFSILFIIAMFFLANFSANIMAGGNIANDPEAKQQILNRFLAYDKVDISGLSDETKEDTKENEVFESPTADSQDYEDPPVAEETFDLENNKESACPDESFTSTSLEQREDGLIYMINEDSPYAGVNCSYYESGAKQEVSNVVEGRAHGSYETWYENGNKKEHFNLEHGLPHGAYKTWYENGSKEKEVNLVNNLFEGPYVLYYENGKPSETGTYANSKLQGQVIFWDEEGNFTKSAIFEDNKVVQESTTPPDNLQEIINLFTADSQDYEDPPVAEETFDLENNNIQLKESFHENGQKKMERHYVNGKENGTSTLWYENGQEQVVINYSEGKRHGLLTRWHENGDIKKTLTYSNGELVENAANE
ncbi:MAG: RDD family protein, partial [Pseudomonadota bacterium]|nr:RDD family protein [Pseudomonadota bacterium]